MGESHKQNVRVRVFNGSEHFEQNIKATLETGLCFTDVKRECGWRKEHLRNESDSDRL